MTRQEHLLCILAEECAEVAHRVSKALRFGTEEIQSTGLYEDNENTNAQRISLELYDLLAVYEMLLDEGIAQNDPSKEELIQNKKDKIEKYLAYSKERGTLTI